MIERFISNTITGHYIYILFFYCVQSFTQVKNDTMLLVPISSFSSRFSVDSNLDISNVMCLLEENVVVVADRRRLHKSSFHTACSLQLGGQNSRHSIQRGFSYHIEGLCVRRSTKTHTSDNLAKRSRLDIACLKISGIYVLSVMQCRCLACRFARLFMTKYCKRIIAITHVCCIQLIVERAFVRSFFQFLI